MQYGTPRDAVKRRVAAFDPTRCNEPAPPGPARRRNSLEELNRPLRSVTAPGPTRCSLSRAARRCCHLRAVRVVIHLPTHPPPGTASDSGDPKATFIIATPSEELTPEDHLAAVSRHLSQRAHRNTGHPIARSSRMTTIDVAADSDRIEARPKAIGDAQPRTDPLSVKSGV